MTLLRRQCGVFCATLNLKSVSALNFQCFVNIWLIETRSQGCHDAAAKSQLLQPHHLGYDNECWKAWHQKNSNLNVHYNLCTQDFSPYTLPWYNALDVIKHWRIQRATVNISELVGSTKPQELSVCGRCSSIEPKRWKEHGHLKYTLLLMKSPMNWLNLLRIWITNW